MSRRNDLLRQLLQSDKMGDDKRQEQEFLATTAELILTDLINIALNAITIRGPGSLVINLQNDSTTFMSGPDIESDIIVAESENEPDILEFLRKLIEEVDTNDWSKYVLITLISDAGTRTFSLEAGGSQESLRKNTAKLSG